MFGCLYQPRTSHEVVCARTMKTAAVVLLYFTVLCVLPVSGSSPPFTCRCLSTFFKCNDCMCIPREWTCDGDKDCNSSEDEENCELPSCSDDEFTCGNRKCIMKSFVCDGDNDCGDHSDELSCAPHKCPDNFFHCTETGKCILFNWLCDNDDDCGDRSDEAHCENQSCSIDDFRCNDGTCISQSWFCDGGSDCPDDSDEQYCHSVELTCGFEEFKCVEANHCIKMLYRCDGHNDCGNGEDEMNCDPDTAVRVCDTEEFRCTNSMCINKNWRCDGDNDCEDGLDETTNCTLPECTEFKFRCTNGHCIPGAWKCDGANDCSDNSDEKGCNITCVYGQVSCNNGNCVPIHKLCNGQDNCGDNTDEEHCDIPQILTYCSESNGGCEHNCTDSLRGAVCSCRRGYDLEEDSRHCRDFDECTLVTACSQMCVNTPGSYKCQCETDYQLKPDGRGCKATGGEAYLIFANRVDIRKVMPDKSEYSSILHGLVNAIALDFHHRLGLVFWSDVTLDKIKRAYLNGSEIKEIIQFGLDSPGGLAVDWIHDKLFWTDSGTSRIEVSKLDGSMRKILIYEKLEKPRALVVHPGEGLIFWTDWGSTPKIERSSMDGGDRMIVANTSLFWPNGLTLDYAANKIYWADAKHHAIESANLDGSSRRTVIDQGLPHPFALTLFEDELYWTDWHTKSINKANKFDGSHMSTIRNQLYYPMDIHTFHPQRQPPVTNHCGLRNGECSHLCLPNIHSFSCGCPTGLQLLEGGKQCSEDISSFILFSTKSDLRRISLDTPDSSDVVIPVTGLLNAVAVAWDSEENLVYWSDVTADSISRAKWDGSQQEVVVGTSLGSPAGVAVDWVARKLYWTGAAHQRIEVSNLDGTMRTVLVWTDVDKPRDIVVDPSRGYMYWTDWGSVAKIERAGMDGTDRIIVVQENLTWPNGLTIDFQLGRLYWLDAGTKTIESSLLDGSNRRNVIPLMSDQGHHPFGLALFNDRLYWTDWQMKSIQSARKSDGQDRQIILSDVDTLMDISIFQRNLPQVSSPCQKNNGGCSHLCLISPSSRKHTCACPTGILLRNDRRTCHEGMSNFLIFAKKTDIRKISLDVEYFADVVIPVENVRNAVAIYVDPVESKVYWSDNMLDKIQRSNLDGSQVEDIFYGLENPDGLALDTTGRKIYWSDMGSNRIEVASLDGKMRKVLIWENLDRPRAIALHYDKGYMYWTDWGKNPRIEWADMDGKNRHVLVSERLGWPNGLTLDRPKSRLIWADARTGVIECVDLTGGHRHQIAPAFHPYGLTLSGDFIYWTDWHTKSIHRANKDDGSQFSDVITNLSGLMDIHAVDAQHDDGSVNVCGADNGGCNSLCLRNPTGLSCACPTGLHLLNDGKTCNELPNAYLMFASRGSIRRISLDTRDFTDVILPLPDLHNAIALDFDIQEKKLYYTDVYLDVIRRADLNGSNMEAVVDRGLTTTDGLAVDWIARNLYWTDTGRDVIEVARLDGSSRLTLIKDNLDEPRAIALFPRKGLMYWTDWGMTPKIERSYMDGSSRRIIVHTDLGYPNGLSIDYDSRRLYWVDAKLDKIETSDLYGRNRAKLIESVPHPFGLAVFGDHIYWTDWQTKSIERADKNTGKDRMTIQSNMEGLMDIHVVSELRQSGSNLCSARNGGCSHLCLASANSFTCACPSYPDDRPCFTVPGAGNHYMTTKGRKNEVTNQDDRMTATGCNEDDGSCGPMSSASVDHNTKSVYIVLGVIVVVVIVGIILTVFIWRRQKRRRSYSSAPSLTFSNPTYQKTSTETISSEKAPQQWNIFKYRKNEESVSIHPPNDNKINNLEAAALVTQMETIDDGSLPHVHHKIPNHKNILKTNMKQTVNECRSKVGYEPIDT